LRKRFAGNSRTGGTTANRSGESEKEKSSGTSNQSQPKQHDQDYPFGFEFHDLQLKLSPTFRASDFNPAKPDAVATVEMPVSPTVSTVKPLGN
jgi:hypothetical protein